MPSARTSRRTGAVLAFSLAGVLLLGACGSDDSSNDASGDTTATTAATGTTQTTASGPSAETVKFDKRIQQELHDVGCYSGNIDGILGPQTDAAIVAFQQASSLKVDGELGPQTETALAKAVAEKKKVCGSPTPSSTTTTAPTPNDPVCSATALAKAAPSGTVITTYVCSELYAGVQGQNAYYGVFKWEAQGGGAPAWVAITPCGAASAGIPPQVLETGCKPA
jgi:peptidoglycan hydrolase-like protein with peptidoglycan-binding domain